MGQQDAQGYSQIPGYLPHFCFLVKSPAHPRHTPPLSPASDHWRPLLVTSDSVGSKSSIPWKSKWQESQVPVLLGRAVCGVPQGQVSSWPQTSGQRGGLWHGSLLGNGAGDPQRRVGRCIQMGHMHAGTAVSWESITPQTLSHEAFCSA